MRALVIVARGLHAGYVGCLGNDWIETTTLDGLAAEGVVFDQHYADRPDAAGAARAWRTGRYGFPAPLGAEPDAPAEGADLVALLRQAGVRSALIGDDRRPAFTTYAAGWDEVCRTTSGGAPAPSLEQTLEAAWPCLDRMQAAGQWLLWLDLATLLPPWRVPEPYHDHYFADDAEEGGEEEPLTPWTGPFAGSIDPPDDIAFCRLQRTYAGAVTYLDAALGRLFDALRDSGLLDELLVVVTTDHGLPLGEHGILGTLRPCLHDELIHLPLLLRLPGGVEAGRRVPALTQPVDLMPTLLEAFGVPAAPVHGHSLMPLVQGAAEEVRAYAAAGLEAGGAIEWALRTRAWSFLLPLAAAPGEPTRAPQLYVKPDDRWEVNNVVQHHMELAEYLEQTLRGFGAATRRPGPLQPPALRDVEAELATAQPAADPNQPPPGRS